MATAKLASVFLPAGKRTERVSWIAARCQCNLIAHLAVAGSCNRDLFELWLEHCLLPQLQPGTVIVIDNASFHCSHYNVTDAIRNCA